MVHAFLPFFSRNAYTDAHSTDAIINSSSRE